MLEESQSSGAAAAEGEAAAGALTAADMLEVQVGHHSDQLTKLTEEVAGLKARVKELDETKQGRAEDSA